MSHPRLLIEDWLPAQAIGVECLRERSTGQQPPDKRLHVWWARRPLTVSRAAVLGSLLPADFDRAVFERLLGFYTSSKNLVQNAKVLEDTRQANSKRIRNPHGPRAFSNAIPLPNLEIAHQAMKTLWGEMPCVLDPMSGGGAIPLEAIRLGLPTYANELNPVACSILEAILDYPFRLGPDLAVKARRWAKVWLEHFRERTSRFYVTDGLVPAYTYIFARTVPCPDTGHLTPLIPDWHLLRTGSGPRLVAEPLVDKEMGTWTVRVREIGKGAGQLHQPPAPTYDNGDGITLFTDKPKPIPGEYIKAMAQQGKLGSALYVVAIKATSKFEFRPPSDTDLACLRSARVELEQQRSKWEQQGVIPIEEIPDGDKTKEPLRAGHSTWASLFSQRQLLALGVLVEELHRLQADIISSEGQATGEAIIHVLALIVDKFLNHNSIMSRWDPTMPKVASVFDRHDYAFKATWAEMAPCVAGGGLEWAIDSVIEAYEKLVALPKALQTAPATITQGSATSLLEMEDSSVSAVVVDPPYADNVQYSELADFFYVWLKRTQGHRRPEWFSTYLCDHDHEAVVNISRNRSQGNATASTARQQAQAFYQQMMTDVFREAHRVLCEDGVLTVMFTHKQQEAWASLFESLIRASFTITATWPIKTESEHSLHQAEKNAAQSSVVLVARKRQPGVGRSYFDDQMKAEIRQAAQNAAARLRVEGLNAVDQLVGAFGPAMAVFSRCDEVFTDTGERVPVAEAIQMAADAVADWRVAQLAEHGLAGVDAESRFILLCWDVLGAAEFRFNEAMLLGRSVGMDVSALVSSRLVKRSGEKIHLLPATERRREAPIRQVADQMELFGGGGSKKARRIRAIHPNDAYFASAIDMCHALALRHAEANGGEAGVGAAKGLALQQGWNADSPCARLMEALVRAAPPAVRFASKGEKKGMAEAFPEFRAWHALLKPLFGIQPPEWQEPPKLQPTLPNM